MSVNGILNADMATLAQWARAGFRWWVAELAAMLPPSWRDKLRRRNPIVVCRDGAVRPLDADSRSRIVDLALPRSAVLVRELQLPTMSLRDLKAYVEVEADRLFPLSDGSLLIDVNLLERLPGNKGLKVAVAALPRDTARAAIVAASLDDFVIAKVGILPSDPAGPLQFDFAPALRASGLLTRQDGRRAIWWSLVGFGILLNIGMLLWRDEQRVTQLQNMVDEQQPAVSIYRAIAGRTARIDRLAQGTVERRALHDPLSDLAAVTIALPDDVWVQRYGWDGRSLALSGYFRPPTDVIAALGRSPRFANVRASNNDVQAAIPIGQPFDIVADLRGSKR